VRCRHDRTLAITEDELEKAMEPLAAHCAALS
jgi:hypothetical protein